MELRFCQQGSGWACNEAGLMHLELARRGEDLRRQNPARAAVPLRRGCELGFEAACRNVEALRNRRAVRSGTGELESAPPGIDDWPVILRGSKGEIRERDPVALHALACTEGWTEMCAR
jgi:hypothetical protein